MPSKIYIVLDRHKMRSAKTFADRIYMYLLAATAAETEVRTAIDSALAAAKEKK